MGNLITNINDDVMAAFEAAQSAKNARHNSFDAKNYLDTKVGEGKESRTTTIRILPIDTESGFPFTEALHFHTVKVPKEVSASGWKSYLCLKKNKDIDHEKFGHKCPFCETNKVAYDKFVNETDPMIRKNWSEVSLANASREVRICRVIERGKENEGVKFWKINVRADRSDAFSQIMKLYADRKAAAEAKGKKENIFNLYEGRDLIVTFHNGTAAPSVIYDVETSPLSDDAALAEKWVLDEKKWTDVFTPKDYNYLSLIVEGKVPYFDKEQGKWISKEDYEAKKEGNAADADTEIAKIEEVLTYQEPEAEAASDGLLSADVEKAMEESKPEVLDDLPF